MLWVGVDVGGTFTDAVLYDEAATELRYAKAPSTPANPTEGVLHALQRLDVPLKEVRRLVHGVTIGTNAILERKGAEVWMLTTEGFRDVLEIARTNRTELYNIKSLKTPPLVPRTRTLEIRERLMYDGSVRIALDARDVRAAAEKIPPLDNGALAICFLHSYANPVHEQAAAKIVRETLNGWFVCTSSDVLPQFREYERFNTTALNAYVGPLMARYLATLRERLAERGYEGQVFIMTSNGGVSTAERAARLPISTVLSGPAGGVAAAVRLGSLLGTRDLITCDMGGTSTDVCLIEGLRLPVTNEQFIGQYANRTPQIQITSVGAGGGSIAWLDAGDILMVGPRSAGADPGPACYGRGGSEPTVTDANLLLGRLSPETLLGGRLRLDGDLAREALARLGERLPGLETHALAEGVIRIAVVRMVSAIKQISIAKGYDPRDFALVAYGGAGPMHAAFIAEELEIPRILVPLGPGNFAAFGSLISDIRHDYVRTRTLQTRQTALTEILAVFADMEKEAGANLATEGVALADIDYAPSLGMRYLGQSWELQVDLPRAVDSIAAIETAFGEVHQRRFGHKGDEPAEIVNFRIAAVGRVAKPELPAWRGGGSLPAAPQGRRSVYFDGSFQEVSVYERDRLPAAAMLAGPAIIEENGATTVVPPRWRAVVLEFGDLLMERETS